MSVVTSVSGSTVSWTPSSYPLVSLGTKKNGRKNTTLNKSRFANAASENRIVDCILEFDDFKNNFEFELIDVNWELYSDEVTFFLGLESELVISLTLSGFWDDKEEFHINGINIKLEKNYENPLSIFLTSTLWAMLGLASKFKVLLPQAGVDLITSLESPINEITSFLQERQLAYRLLVISSAASVLLPFPKRPITGDEVENIAFCYHTIAERSFKWFLNPTVIPWNANQESLTWLPPTNTPTSITFQPEFTKKSIFGIEISLGYMTAKIDAALIDNYDEVKSKLYKLDENIVDVKLRSLTGTSEMILLKGLILPEKPFSEKLQKLIDLDSLLDDVVLKKFFSIASSTLDGLTDEQKNFILEQSDFEIE